MTGLLLHLSGPLQSWGSRSYWNERDTLPVPSRSGLIGLLAATCGHPRDHPLDDYSAVEFTVRVDRPGRLLVDYHTVAGGRDRDHTPPLAGGGRRAEGKGTIVSHRHYLTDAAFTIALTHPNPEWLDDLDVGLRAPIYGPHLGRRSCPPTAPLLIGRHPDPVTALRTSVPLARPTPRQAGGVGVEFVSEHPPADGAMVRSSTTTTWPVQFAHPRVHQPHTTWHTTHQLDPALCAGYGMDYLDALITYTSTLATP